MGECAAWLCWVGEFAMWEAKLRDEVPIVEHTMRVAIICFTILGAKRDMNIALLWELSF